MFTHNLSMKLKPGNIVRYCCVCICGCCCRKHESYKVLDEVDATDKASKYAMIANADRPLDIIGFFSNDDLFLTVEDALSPNTKELLDGKTTIKVKKKMIHLLEPIESGSES